jgi:PAS domain S-box-containing protein
VSAQLAFLGNLVIAVAYAAISATILVPVVGAGQLRSNRLATATALIFFSCSVGHGFHALHAWWTIMAVGAMPGMASESGGWVWPSAVWDLFTAAVGVYYWTLRRGYGVLLSPGRLYVDPGQQQLLDDVHERERVAAERVARHQAALAAVVEQSDDAIIATTLDGTITAWNAGAERMFGYSAAEAIGAPADTMPRTDEPDHIDLGVRVAAGERGIRYETRVFHRDGSVVDMSVTGSPILDENGSIAGVSRIARDLTAAKRAEGRQRAAEERAQQVQRMASLGQLAGGVAHDFNNLLGIILNFTSFATETAGEQAQLDLRQVQAAAERAVGLARQLLTFTRQDTIRPELLDVNAAVAETRAMLVRTIGKHIELIAVPAPAPIMIFADAGHVQQILVNLAVNARDAMPDGGTLVIEAKTVDLDGTETHLQPVPSPGRYARLMVSDTGTGMSPQVAARMFEPFYTTKPRGQGTGLGLATVYGIIAGAGGSIDVTSEPGIGTTFRVYFPITDVGQPTPGQTDVAQAPTGHGQTVLVVEDEPALAQAVARILDEGGYRALTANDPAEALALDTECGCDLLLTDVVLPEMSGRRLAERLQRRHPDLAVLFMSGYTDGQLGAERILDDGIAFIEKPFTANLLLTRVGEVFGATVPGPVTETPAQRSPLDMPQG